MSEISSFHYLWINICWCECVGWCLNPSRVKVRVGEYDASGFNPPETRSHIEYTVSLLSILFWSRCDTNKILWCLMNILRCRRLSATLSLMQSASATTLLWWSQPELLVRTFLFQCFCGFQQKFCWFSSSHHCFLHQTYSTHMSPPPVSLPVNNSLIMSLATALEQGSAISYYDHHYHYSLNIIIINVLLDAGLLDGGRMSSLDHSSSSSIRL